jgi:regulatory protein
VRRRKYGAGRILHELREKGVSAATLGGARERLRKDELAAARAVWQKKFGVVPKTLAEKAKQARFLAGRGFSAEAVHAVLKGGIEDHEQ